MPEPLTVAEAAALTGKSRRTIGRMATDGRLPGAERTSKGWRIPADDLDAFTDEPTEPTAPAAGETLAEVRAELAEWRLRAEVAEAVAAERADALSDARTSLALAQRLAAVNLAENLTPYPAENRELVEQSSSPIRRWLPRRWR